MSGSTAASQPDRRGKPSRPSLPWRPGRLHIISLKPATNRAGDTVYELRWKVDAWELKKQCATKAKAKGWHDALIRGDALGWYFDPSLRTYVDPATRPDLDQDAEDAVSLWSAVRRYWAATYPNIQPNSRQNVAHHLARIVLWCVEEDARTPWVERPRPALKTKRDVLLAFLYQHVFVADPTPRDKLIGNWARAYDHFEKHSLPVTAMDKTLVEEWRTAAARTVDADTGTSRPRAPSSVKSYHRKMRAFLNWLLDMELLTADPWPRHVRATTAMSDDDEVDVGTLLDEKAILRCVEAAWQRGSLLIAAGILLCGLCGLRPQEVVELRRRDVVLPSKPGERGRIYVRHGYSRAPARFLDGDPDDPESRSGPTKSGKRRDMPLPALAVPLLRAALDGAADGSDAYVFHREGEDAPFSAAYLAQQWVALRDDTLSAAELSGKATTLRDLRHSFVTIQLRAGVPYKTVAKWSGHADLNVMLNTYTGAFDDDEQLAAARQEAHLAGLSLEALSAP